VRDLDIVRWRLRNQRLVRPFAGSADEVVETLLAVQAENPSQAAWAVASRTSRQDPADLAALLGSGAVVRTHVLRPTWHFVRAQDIGWLLDLTGPRLRQITGRALDSAHGMDGASVSARLTAITSVVAGEGPLTRTQLAEGLQQRGTEARGQLLMMLVMYAELEGLICSGPPGARGEHTYALMGQRVAAVPRPDRGEALAGIALRYFTGHGPATERDLVYWASLTLTDVRAGLAQVRDQLESFGHDGRTYWHAPGEEPPAGPGEPGGHILQVLDETYRGYQDSRWLLDTAGAVPRTRETAVGMALAGAQLVASMRRTITGGRVEFALGPYRPLTPPQRSALEEAAARYGEFLGLEPRLVLA
jgi:hypothetical protein